MPFYEYQCQACGAQVEVMQKITDAPLKKCPECGKSRLTKLVSAPVFRLKGSGWYETDFKTDKDKKRNLVESEKGESKSDAKSDEKPSSDAKATAKPEAKESPKAESRPTAKPVSKSVKSAKPTKPAKKKARR